MGTISSAAVKTKTGKDWDAWFADLDHAGAAAWPHKQIAAFLAAAHAVPPWWSQMIAVEFERARGLRSLHSSAAGYSASITRTLPASIELVYTLWADPARRAQWLTPEPKIRKATQNRSLRITWPDGTNVDVMFYPKGAAKMQLAIEHARLPGPAAVQAQKDFWAAAIARLKTLLP